MLQFEPFGSSASSDFWYELEKKKLTQWKLDSSAKQIWGSWTYSPNERVNARFSVHRDCFVDSDAQKIGPFHFSAPGVLQNFNTVDEFKSVDKNQIMKEAGQQVWQSIQSMDWLCSPESLARFTLITFADLKVHKFTYWFGFPALVPSTPIKTVGPPQPISATFSPDEMEAIRQGFDHMRGVGSTASTSKNVPFFFVAKRGGDSPLKAHALSELPAVLEESPRPEITLCAADAGSLASHPGWTLRNLLVAFFHSFGESLKGQSVRVMCYREVPGKADISKSVVFELAPLDGPVLNPSAADFPQTTGWEKNGQGKLAPRVMDLGSMMDPVKLAESSVALNLQLMRWRMLPSLEVDSLASTKCLLLGSGTLGCHVARNLMAWGIHNITFVDHGKVSYSNPVRQSLFTFADSAKSASKAQAAAQRLAEVFPSVNVNWCDLTIPMPGHVVTATDRPQVEATVDKLKGLVESHDVVFLLTDTRESRWLPTLLCSALGKICINTALGFDSFLVMRHGVRALGSDVETPTLGCYFCNDIVAPRDSTVDRTLDQQCTVTRPGCSAVASALATELLASIIHHPSRGLAEADGGDDQGSTPLGIVPHQVRGFLSSFSNMVLVGKAYRQCTACSDTVVGEWRARGIDFLVEAFNDPHHLEVLTGLDEMHRQAEESLSNWVDEDGDDFAGSEDDF